MIEDDNYSEMTMLSFLSPFSSSMWLSIVIAYVMVSLMMFFVSRISPYERYRIGIPYQSCSEGNYLLKILHKFYKNNSFYENVVKLDF